VSRTLSNVALPHLQQLLGLVRAGDLAAPLTATAVQARGLGHCWAEVAWLAPLDRAGLEAVLAVAVAERTMRPVPRLELVWTGPEARVSTARDTAVVVRELFARAQRSVLVAGFSFTSGRDIFEPLHLALRDRVVEARLFLHIDDVPGLPADDCARRGIEAFLRDNWPFGEPLPAIYYDPRTVAASSTINLHAKCVVVDDRFTLIGSANFTHNAHARNIEAGVLVEDTGLARDLSRQWQGLVDEMLVRRANLDR
jgi:phosphatidylserine/phosphatidylglycerophosphate/cardiolipin synthase-like enzyme